MIATRKKRMVMVMITAAISLMAFLAMVILLRNQDNLPQNINIIVAWNPYSITDEMASNLSLNMDTNVSLEHLLGANGARGKNEVFATGHNGENVLATSLSAFLTAEAMGFGETSHYDWAAWLCIFSPAVVAVAPNSPYTTISDMINDIAQNPNKTTVANSGFGTTSFAAAELFATNLGLNFEHMSLPGVSPVINAVLGGDADFAILLSTEASQLRIIATFTEELLVLDDVVIPSIYGINANLDAILPFGEYYGIFAPKTASQSRLNHIQSIVQNAAASEDFTTFAQEEMLIALNPSKTQSEIIIDHIYPLTIKALQDGGFLR